MINVKCQKYQNNYQIKMRYSLFIGRWQCIPPHKGHIALIESVLNEGKNVLIAIRDTEKDEKNPYDIKDRERALMKAFKKWGNKVKIIAIPDIEDVCYGRGVGWGIRKIKLSKELERISGTKIREELKKGS